MYERLLITFVVMTFLGVVFLLLKRRQITLANRASRQSNKQTSKATIVYFWSDGCPACKRAQRPILEGLLAEYSKEQLSLTAYNIDETPEAAKKWGVMTLPTTLLLDASGTVKHANNGLIALGKLRNQLKPMIFGQ
jgi:thiol-disulfide isomerase/thioredoxin